MSKPMVCVTADVHHDLNDTEQRYSKNEHIFAKEYQEIIERYNGSATFFVTGKCINEHIEFWKKFSKNYNVELGGHTYWAFRPRIILKLNRKLFRSIYGGTLYKYLDIKKTIHAFSKIDIPMKIWRTHTYLQNSTVYNILANNGVQIVSDYTRNYLNISFENGITYVPITALNDDKIFAICCDRGNQIEMRYEWQRVEYHIKQKMEKKEDIVILLHPIIMKIYDNFVSFESLVKEFLENGYNFVTISELVDKVGRKQFSRESEI